MTVANTVFQVFEVVSDLIGPLGELVLGLIEAGKSPKEAGEIVRRDIKSLRARYEQEKAEDERRLAEKHGLSTVPANPFENDRDRDTEPPKPKTNG